MAALPHTVYAGTSGWAYASWKPGFYPAGTRAAGMLAYYATRLNSVEVNYTFRRLPTGSQMRGWLEAVPADFRFSFKAPQAVTHHRRLEGCDAEVAAFAKALEPAARDGKLGLALFQLPPNFRADLARLRSFLERAVPLGLRLAFEFRHASWFADPVFDVLAAHQAALCVAESDTLETPDRRTAAFCCYRLRRSRYSEAEMRRVAARCAGSARQGDVYAYFMHEEQPDGPLRAVALREALGRRP